MEAMAVLEKQQQFDFQNNGIGKYSANYRY